MSVDFYACLCCGESRYSEYVGHCTSCGKRICTNCVVNDDVESEYANDYGVVYDGSDEQKAEYELEDGWFEEGDIIDDTSIQPKYCPFCDGSEVDDSDLLEFALKQLGKTKDELIQTYLETK